MEFVRSKADDLEADNNDEATGHSSAKSKALTKTGGNHDSCGVAMDISGFMCGCFVLPLGIFGLGVAEITLGAIYFHQCPIEEFIPINMLSFGTFKVTISGFHFISLIKYIVGCDADEKKEENKKKSIGNRIWTIILNILRAAYLCYFVYGNVLVFRIYDKYELHPDPTDPKHCDAVLYLFAFWSIITTYFLALAVALHFVYAKWYGCRESEVDEETIALEMSDMA